MWGELLFEGFPLIVGEGTAAEGADFGKGGEVGIFGDVPAVVDEAGLFLYLMLDPANVIPTDHCGVVFSSLFILEKEDGVGLVGGIGFHSCFFGDSDLPTVLIIELIYQASKDLAVGGGILDLMEMDIVVDHLVEQYVLILSLRELVEVGKLYPLFCVDGSAISLFCSVRKATHLPSGRANGKAGLRQRALEVLMIEFIEPVLYPLKVDLKGLFHITMKGVARSAPPLR